MRRMMFSLLAATLLAGAPVGFAYAQGVGGMGGGGTGGLGGGSDSINPGAGAGGPPRAAEQRRLSIQQSGPSQVPNSWWSHDAARRQPPQSWWNSNAYQPPKSAWSSNGYQPPKSAWSGNGHQPPMSAWSGNGYQPQKSAWGSQ